MITTGCAKGCLFTTIIILSMISVFWFADFEMRDYRNIENRCFTFWKTDDGCYIMPYKYRKLWYPQNDYMLASNTCTIHIFCNNDNVLHVFTENDPPAKHDEVVFHLTSYDYEYVRAKDVIDPNVYKQMDSLKSLNCPFISVIIKDIGGITKSH